MFNVERHRNVFYRTLPLTESIQKHTLPKKDIGVTSKTFGKDRKNSGTKGKKLLIDDSSNIQFFECFLMFIFFIQSGGFDVYNIETAMPLIDLDAIENHLRAAREEERRVCTHNFCINPYLSGRKL